MGETINDLIIVVCLQQLLYRHHSFPSIDGNPSFFTRFWGFRNFSKFVQKIVGFFIGGRDFYYSWDKLYIVGLDSQKIVSVFFGNFNYDAWETVSQSSISFFFFFYLFVRYKFRHLFFPPFPPFLSRNLWSSSSIEFRWWKHLRESYRNGISHHWRYWRR